MPGIALSSAAIEEAQRRVLPGTARFDPRRGAQRTHGALAPNTWGLYYNLELRWDGVPSLADAMRMLREQAQRTPPNQWVRVMRASAMLPAPHCRPWVIPATRPTRQAAKSGRPSIAYRAKPVVREKATYCFDGWPVDDKMTPILA
jgi:hypothetical protein